MTDKDNKTNDKTSSPADKLVDTDIAKKTSTVDAQANLDSPEKAEKPPVDDTLDESIDKSQGTVQSSAESEDNAATPSSAEDSQNIEDSDKKIKKANKLSKLAIAISVIAIGISAYQIYATYSIGTTAVDKKLAAMQEQLSADIAASATANNKALTNTNASVNTINSKLRALQSTNDQKLADINALQERLTKSIQQVEAAGAKRNARKDWLLAEVEYLLRLANQRVLMEKTPIGALALLKSADNILQQTDDVSIFAVRKALARDIATLGSVPNIDQEGLYLKLDALSEQINQLKLVPLTDKKKLPSILDQAAKDAADVEQGNISKVWDKVTDKLAKLVVINHRDSAIEPLLSPAQQAGLLQNLHILFEQAQLALLQRKQNAYQKSLEKAQLIINSYFQQEDPVTQNLISGLQSLEKATVDVEIPSIAGSLNTLKAYLKQSSEIKANAGKGAAN